MPGRATVDKMSETFRYLMYALMMQTCNLGSDGQQPPWLAALVAAGAAMKLRAVSGSALDDVNRFWD
jgi:hypothetical protein